MYKKHICFSIIFASILLIGGHVFALSAVREVEIGDSAAGTEKNLKSDPEAVQMRGIVDAKNPKFSGKFDNSLQVSNVELQANQQLLVSGKARPGQKITIYIFSEDPIVISVQTDANGHWNYQLNKELSDGQHFIFVCVTDEQGNIITKGNPLAFIKTAQAATVVPFTQLEDFQSPMKKMFWQYFFAAFIVVATCVLSVLLFMGKISIKRN